MIFPTEVDSAPPPPTWQVKKLVIETYAATTRASNLQTAKDVRRALIPILYLDCDRWTSQLSDHEYIGELVLESTKTERKQ
ncbi:unnamed protein product [Ectocarpus fasciculatus]